MYTLLNRYYSLKRVEFLNCMQDAYSDSIARSFTDDPIWKNCWETCSRIYEENFKNTKIEDSIKGSSFVETIRDQEENLNFSKRVIDEMIRSAEKELQDHRVDLERAKSQNKTYGTLLVQTICTDWQLNDLIGKLETTIRKAEREKDYKRVQEQRAILESYKKELEKAQGIESECNNGSANTKAMVTNIERRIEELNNIINRLRKVKDIIVKLVEKTIEFEILHDKYMA